MELYNTLTRRVETFEPADGRVRIYVCGITPYDATHLGHALTYACSDVLIRFLRHLGYRTEYVQNLTDIDDAILRAAHERGEHWRELGQRWTQYYLEDMKTLNILAPDHFPRATEHIPQMQRVIRTLLDRGVAYESGGGVYFQIDAWTQYGRLSRLARKDMLTAANEHGNHPDDPRKRDPLDFALWKAEAPGEPSWESPWGPGRPGWHIECSTMATEYLGDTVDIHGGGRDLVFPHHEGEIAQSECATHHPFCRFWFHTAMLRHKGEKMSKSVGNLVMARDLLEDHSPDALRIYLIRHHYREPWAHDATELREAQQIADKLREAVKVKTGTATPSAGDPRHTALDPSTEVELCRASLARDLDSPGALRALATLAENILGGVGGGLDVSFAQTALREMSRVLGLRLDRQGPESEVARGWAAHERGA